jgi:hypothetical protein
VHVRTTPISTVRFIRPVYEFRHVDEIGHINRMPTSSDRDEPPKPPRKLVLKKIKNNHRSVTQAKLEALTRMGGNNPPTPCVVCQSLTPNICGGDRCQPLTQYFPSPFCFSCQSLHRYCPQCTLEEHFLKTKQKRRQPKF